MIICESVIYRHCCVQAKSDFISFIYPLHNITSQITPLMILLKNGHIMDIKIRYSFFNYVQIYRRANDKQITIEATVSFHSLCFPLAPIQFVFRLFCLHLYTSVSFKHCFHSHMCVLVLQNYLLLCSHYEYIPLIISNK